MKNTKIIITFLIFIFITAISIFNYKMNPYGVFDKKDTINIFDITLDKIYIPLKLHKESFDYVVYGGSTFKLLHIENYNPKIANICYPKMNIINAHKVLFAFLDLHPETKTIFLPLDFVAIGARSYKEIPDFTGKNLTLKEIYQLFLSPQTTKYSYCKNHKLKKQQEKPTIAIRKTQLIQKDKTQYIEIGQKHYKDIIEKLKQRNIKIIPFSAPYPACALAYFDEVYTFDAMAEIKRYIVNQTGFLIDFAIINKYTSKPIEEQWFLFEDMLHPRKTYGYLIYNVLFDTKQKDKDIYVILTKDNIETELKKQKQALIKWKKEHKKEYKDYLDINKEPKQIIKNIEDMPEEFKKL